MGRPPTPSKKSRARTGKRNITNDEYFALQDLALAVSQILPTFGYTNSAKGLLREAAGVEVTLPEVPTSWTHHPLKGLRDALAEVHASELRNKPKLKDITL